MPHTTARHAQAKHTTRSVAHTITWHTPSCRGAHAPWCRAWAQAVAPLSQAIKLCVSVKPKRKRVSSRDEQLTNVIKTLLGGEEEGEEEGLLSA